MPTLVLALMVTAATEAHVVGDPRGFHFTVPAGFESFPKFQPTATKLYAFGKNLGTPEAVTLTIDVLEGPTRPDGPSRSCGALLNSIDRTIGSPLVEQWRGDKLNGLRMLMTHVFGEVLVFCVDVPVSPNALSVMVSGKPGNEPLLHDVFTALLASLATGEQSHDGVALLGGALLLVLAALGYRMRSRPSKGT